MKTSPAGLYPMRIGEATYSFDTNYELEKWKDCSERLWTRRVKETPILESMIETPI